MGIMQVKVNRCKSLDVLCSDQPVLCLWGWVVMLLIKPKLQTGLVCYQCCSQYYIPVIFAVTPHPNLRRPYQICHQYSITLSVKGDQAFWAGPLMLHEACTRHMAGCKWRCACDSRRAVYAENPHQLCFFASSVFPFAVCHPTHGLLHSAFLIARRPVFMSCD